MTLEVRKRPNNIIAKATVMGFPLREKSHNVHRLNILWDGTFMHLRAMDTQMALRGRNKTTIRTLYKRGLRHNGTGLHQYARPLIKGNTATVRNTGIPHN